MGIHYKRVVMAAAAALCMTSCEEGVIMSFVSECGDCGDLTCCNGRCVDLNSSTTACGNCETVCNVGEFCQGAVCTPSKDACGGCVNGLDCCGTTCLDTRSDVHNCGVCGHDCGDGMICQDGRCAEKSVMACDENCVAPRICCNDVCVNAESNNDHCGSCGNVCDDGYCDAGQCRVSAASCKDGCGALACCGEACVDLKTDAQHCGSCDNACSANMFCQNGSCAPACVCEGGQVCNAKGVCVPSCGGVACGDDELCCNDKCVGALRAETCGSCDNVCSGNSPVCADGVCVADCGEGKKSCDGTCVDLQSDSKHCGTCDNACLSGQTCQNGSCECKPKTCADFKYTCGTASDGCGNEIYCGACVEGERCLKNVCGCQATTCAAQGKNCGEIDDGCGKKLNCGSCSNGETCNNNVCGCVPATCASLGKNCGEVDDGCGKKLNCGSCSNGETCTNNVCNCAPTTCAAKGKDCGDMSDGCGKTLNCGTCSGNKTCKSNVCTCAPTTCAAKGFNCGEMSDGCGKTLNCGTCSGGSECKSNKCVSTALAYPTRKSIKGIQPDFQDPNQIIGNQGAGVAMNMVWMNWQPSQSTSCSSGQVKYDGYCYNIDSNTANAIKTYSDNGLVVTAVVYGVPSWARRTCNNNNVVADYFCAPTEAGAKEYGRFVGFLANYFNGQNGHGRIADFVIHNEVNASEWFNYGCTKGNCNVDTWADVYAQSWNAAYDYATKEQPNCKVLISFEHHFGSTFDSMLSNARPVVSAQTFLGKLIPKLGSRDWRIAWHSYPPDLTKPAFGANDWPRVTFGNLGVLAGWLRQNYPSDPHAWEIQLTENGINGVGDAMQAKQATQLCQAFRNILGTPGIESFIYHRLVDHPTEVAQGLGLGLWNPAGSSSIKPAWSVWALANRSIPEQGYPSCGFEDLPYIRIRSGYNQKMHWVTSRQFPDGFTEVKGESYRVLREPASNTKLIYECRVGGASGAHTMPSPDANCEGQFNMGPLGYFYTSQVSGTIPLYRCYNASKGDHFISSNASCGGSTKESIIGYVLP